MHLIDIPKMFVCTYICVNKDELCEFNDRLHFCEKNKKTKNWTLKKFMTV